jgi:hypothetical protein
MRSLTPKDGHPYGMQLKFASILLFAAACLLLNFGTGMLFVVPGYPGEGYFVTKRILYGLLPTVCSAALLVAVGWLWSRSSKPEDYMKYVKRSFLYAMVAISLFWLGLIIIADFRQA